MIWKMKYVEYICLAENGSYSYMLLVCFESVKNDDLVLWMVWYTKLQTKNGVLCGNDKNWGKIVQEVVN